MQKISSEQKKKLILNYIYATVAGILVVACAIIIALANAKPEEIVQTDTTVTDETIVVATTTYVAPMKNATIAKDYSATELQFNDTLKQWEIHKAIDFIANEDTNVYAISNGTVSNIYTNYLEGTVIEISHGNGLVSVYKSLNKDVSVSIGNKVTAGQVIGNVADTMAQELNNGAHLHFELQKNGSKINPNDYLDLGSK